MPDTYDIAVHFDEDKPPIRCTSIDELDAVLDELGARADPTRGARAVAIVVFEHEIDTGLGADPTFLCLQMAPRDGEYYVAVGDRTDGEPRAFYGAGQDSYWNPRNLIAAADARSAIRYFIRHQARSRSLRWEDWTGSDA